MGFENRTTCCMPTPPPPPRCSLPSLLLLPFRNRSLTLLSIREPIASPGNDACEPSRTRSLPPIPGPDPPLFSRWIVQPIFLSSTLSPAPRITRPYKKKEKKRKRKRKWTSICEAPWRVLFLCVFPSGFSRDFERLRISVWTVLASHATDWESFVKQCLFRACCYKICLHKW